MTIIDELPIRSDHPEAAAVLDHQAFEELVVEHRERVLSYCRRFALNSAAPEDLAQETWLVAWQNLSAYRNRGSVAGWLLHIARTVCLRATAAARRRECVPIAFDLAAPPPASTSAAELLQDMEDEQLSMVLALPPRQRRVVLLRLACGFTTAATATEMRCSTGTVKATLHQAVRALRSSRAAADIERRLENADDYASSVAEAASALYHARPSRSRGLHNQNRS